MTTLNDMMEQALLMKQHSVESQQREALERKHLLEQEAEQRLSTVLTALLTEEFLEQIGPIVYEHTTGPSQAHATFQAVGTTWRLTPAGSGDFHVHYKNPVLRNGSDIRSGTISSETQLLLLMGMYQQQALREQQEKADRDIKQAARAELERIEEEKNERERALRAANVQDVHDHLSTLVRNAVAEATERLWRWPEGVGITLYRCSFCIGAVTDGEGGIDADYRTGWTRTPTLDNLSRVVFQPERRGTWTQGLENEKNYIVLPAFHKPFWEEIVVSSLEELPELLRVEKRVTFPTIGIRYNSDLSQDAFYTFEEGEYGSYAYQEKVGEEPLEWVEELVEQAAARGEGAVHGE